MKRIIYACTIAAGLLVGGYLAAGLMMPVALEWDGNDPAPEGYRLFRRLDGQAYDYTAPVWQGAELRAVSDCPAGETCFWVVRAYLGDTESGDSNEVTFFTAPDGLPPGELAGLTLKAEGNIMFLTADPVPDGTTSEGTDYFEVELDGAVTRSDGESDGAGQIRLRHDLTALEFGDHTARARRVNSWGAGEWTAPLPFRASTPGALSGFGLSDN